MTTGATAPARVPTPRPKAPPTSSLSSESVAATTTSTTGAAAVPSRPGSSLGAASRSSGTRATSQPGAAARRGPRAAGPDPLSDRTTAFLIRRVLCPEQQHDKGRDTPAPIEDLLPPLTSRNDIDLQLYALIAIILREYVQKWYNRITPDETFVAETVQTIAHCTRALEQRLRKVDLESLLFDEIPDLLDKHVNTYRAAQSHVARPPVQTVPREIYHSTWPLPALSPVPRVDAPSAIAEQAENEAAYRQLLVQAVLALLLPTEDLDNECLTTLVGQIFSELIIGNIVANRVAEPWLVWEGLIILSGVIRRRASDPSAQSSSRSTTNSRPTSAGRSFSVQGLFLSLLHWCFFLANLIRVVATTAVSSRSIPRRTRYYSTGRDHEVTRQKSASLATNPADLTETLAEPIKVPVLAFRIWPAISNLIEMDMRMPWLCGALSFLQWTAITGPGRIADVDGVVDRLISHSVIHAHVLDAATLPPLLRNVRGALFPNNAPGNPTLKAPSSDAELRALRRRCASALWALVPKSLGSLYFGGGTGSTSTSTSTRSWRVWSSLVSSSASSDAGTPRNQNQVSPQYQQSVAGGVTGDRVQGPGVGPRVARTQLAPGHSTGPGPTSLPRSGPANNANSGLDLGDIQAASYSGSDRSMNLDSLAQSSTGGAAVSVGGGDGPVGPGLTAFTGRQQEQATQYGQDVRRAARVPVGRGDGDGDKEGGTKMQEAVEEDEEEERILTEIETGIVDVFGDAYCNKHLMYGILELVLVRLMPELAEKGVVDLWEERLS